MTIDAKGQQISGKIVSTALAGIQPKWSKAHSVQLKAWHQTDPAAIGIGGVSVMLDDSMPQTVVQFVDSTAVRTPDPDPEKAKDGRNDHITTTLTLLAEIVNLAVPA